MTPYTHLISKYMTKDEFGFLKNPTAQPVGSLKASLLLDDFQNLHGASLDTNAAGDALGGVGAGGGGGNDDLEGADLCALAAAGAELLVDHVHAGLGVLGDGAGFANLSTLAALNADIGLGLAVLLNDLNAGLGHIEFLVECLREIGRAHV